MFGIQVFDDERRDMVNFIRPVYVMDYFHINAWSSGQKNYSFEHDLFTIDWISSFGQSSSNASLNIHIENNSSLHWNAGGYSFDIFVFLRVI